MVFFVDVDAPLFAAGSLGVVFEAVDGELPEAGVCGALEEGLCARAKPIARIPAVAVSTTEMNVFRMKVLSHR